jgi:acyl-CoA synthetase (AMP-forming)/AMP-acid ligase II
MAHLWNVIAASAGGDTALHPASSGGQRVGLADLLGEAEHTAGQVLGALGGRAPRRLGVLMANGEPWVRGVLAATRLDSAVVPLPLPVAFAGPDAYIRHLRRIAEDAQFEAVLVDASLRRATTAMIARDLPDVSFIDITERSNAAPPPPVAAGDDALAVIQYTSGSTSAPKGVTVTHGNVGHGLSAVVAGLELTRDDTFGLWVPLYHDMGLFCMLASFSCGASVWLWRPADFIRRPLGWLERFALAGATVLAAPNFSFDHMVAGAKAEPCPGLDLSRWRVAANGAEPVQRRTLEAFEKTFGRYGLRDETLDPVYGMAEATLMISGRGTRARWSSVLVDRDRLGVGQQVRLLSGDAPAATGRAVVCCGSAVPGLGLRIAGPQTQVLPAGVVGEVQITGPAVTRGYLHPPAQGQPFTADGWLRTGDLGFLIDDELYLIGRLKDMIIVRGQNYYAEDVEEIVRAVPGAASRRSAAVPWAKNGTERMAVIVETSLDPDEAAAVAVAARERIRSHLGLDAVDVIPVPPATIPFTTSGKVKRGATLDLVRDSLDPDGATVPARGASR